MSSSPTRPPPPVAWFLPPPAARVVVVVVVVAVVVVSVVPAVVPVVVVVESAREIWVARRFTAGARSAFGPLCGASSKVIAIRPPSLYAGDRSISGTTVCRNSSAAVESGGGPGRAWLFGPVVAAVGHDVGQCRGVVGRSSDRLRAVRCPTSCLAQALPSISDWKYTNGLRHVTYGSLAVGAWSGSVAPNAGWRQVAASPGTPLPTPSTYASSSCRRR